MYHRDAKDYISTRQTEWRHGTYPKSSTWSDIFAEKLSLRSKTHALWGRICQNGMDKNDPWILTIAAVGSTLEPVAAIVKMEWSGFVIVLSVQNY